MDLLRPGRKRYLVGVLVAAAIAAGTVSSGASTQKGPKGSVVTDYLSVVRQRLEGPVSTRPVDGVDNSIVKTPEVGNLDEATRASSPPLRSRRPRRTRSGTATPSVSAVATAKAKRDLVAPVIAPSVAVSASPASSTSASASLSPAASSSPAATVAREIVIDAAARPVDFSDTAIVTMAAGDESARLAIALIQSLRDVQTVVPTIVVMLARGGVGSADCVNHTWKVSVGRADNKCQAADAIAQEIVSGQYLDTFARLGAETLIVDSIPETEYTSQVPGGRAVVRYRHPMENAA